jgi:hypothetical protein
MKRTTEKVIERSHQTLERGTVVIFPKGIRTKTLKFLCHLNYWFFYHDPESNIIDNSKQTIEQIMKMLGVSKRTAYDYYTALINLHYFPEFFQRRQRLSQRKQILDFEKEGIDYFEFIKQLQSSSQNSSASDAPQS